MKPCHPPNPDERARLREAYALHVRSDPTGPAYCTHCRIEWPCPTSISLRRALDSDT